MPYDPKSRKQYTVRIPYLQWAWLKHYHKKRRALREQQEDAGVLQESLRFSVQDTLNLVIETGLKTLHPLSEVDMELVLGSPKLPKGPGQ